MEKMIPAPHQVADSDAMLEYEHAFLWAEPGTGKTLTAMEAFRKGDYEKLVVICPKIAVSMWYENLTTQLGMKYVQPIRSSYMPKRNLTADGRSRPPEHMADAMIITTDLIRSQNPRNRMIGYVTDYDKKRELIKPRHMFRNDRRGAREYVQQFKGVGKAIYHRTALIVDESHNFSKSTAKRTKTLHDDIQSFFTDVWQLTGTPMTKHADDYFYQLMRYRKEILAHYNVDTFEKWKNEFCVQRQRKVAGRTIIEVSASKNLSKLAEVLKACGVIQRRLSDVVSDLPPITYRTVSVDVKGVPTIEFSETDLIRLLNQPDSEASKTRRILGIAKTAGIAEYILEQRKLREDAKQPQRPVLVGYWHTDVMGELRERLEEAGHSVEVINGKTPPKEREEIVTKFNLGTIDYVLGQVKAMGVAINMQENCDHVIVAEELPLPSDLEQFIARVYRRGQKEHVQIDLVRADHSLDSGIRNLRERRAREAETVKKRIKGDD